MSETAIEVSSLTKRFGSVVAVDGITFDVGRSEVFGFLGPNGAGKTTTIKMLTTLVPPTTGSAKVMGFDLARQGMKVRERIGVVQQQDSYDQGLSVETSMDLYGMIWGVPRAVRQERIEELIERFGMREYRKTGTGDLSGGQRRRLQVAREFVHDMDILFLDEPTVGLDPIARRDFLNYFRERVKDGLTIFFTTHILEEAEYLCNRIAIINKGRIVAIDTPQNLKRKFGTSKAVEFRILEEGPRDFAAGVEKIPGVSSLVQDDGGAFRAVTAKPELVIPEIYRLAERLGLTISSIYIAETTLEDAFITVVSDDGAGKGS